MRTPRTGRARLLVLLGTLLLLPAPARAGSLEDLDTRLRRKVVEATRAYLEPGLEFLWRPRVELLEALEEVAAQTRIRPLADVPFLRELVYEGRRFLERFDDRGWRREHGVTTFDRAKGIYYNLESEQLRFSYAQPRSYPKERVLDKIGRPAPWPLLVTIPEEQDTVDQEGQAAEFPGMAVMERRFPKSHFDDFYDHWLVLAPVAARARFLEDDGRVRHAFLTSVITEFWRRYHVDFDRIVLDGTEAAFVLAATFPQVFAGLVLRPGSRIRPEQVLNVQHVPVFVVDDEALADDLAAAGHPDVVAGTAKDVVAWLDRRRRVVPRSFSWRVVQTDQLYSNWITIVTADFGAPERRMEVEVLDTEADPNTIRITADGIDSINLFLNDEIVDLDRPVRIIANGMPVWAGRPERDFDQLFAKDPVVRKNMNFGWLYPVLVADVDLTGAGPSVVEVPDADAREAEARAWWDKAQEQEERGFVDRAVVYYRKCVDVGDTSWRVRALQRLAALRGEVGIPAIPGTTAKEPPAVGRLSDDDVLEAQRLFLLGRLDLLDAVLAGAAHPDDALALAVRDLWWRKTSDPALRARYERLFEMSEGLTRERYRWLLDGGPGPWPEDRGADDDRWRVLTALVQDRQMREKTGSRHLPDASPLRTLEPPAAWADWWEDYERYMVERLVREGYEGRAEESLTPEEIEERAESVRTAEETEERNWMLAIVLLAIFVGGTLMLGSRWGPRRREET